MMRGVSLYKLFWGRVMPQNAPDNPAHYLEQTARTALGGMLIPARTILAETAVLVKSLKMRQSWCDTRKNY